MNNETNPQSEIPNPQFIKRLCRQHGFLLHGPDRTAAEALPIVQQHLAELQRNRPDCLTELSGDYHEWKQNLDLLAQLIHQLQTLAAPPQSEISDLKSEIPPKKETPQKSLQNPQPIPSQPDPKFTPSLQKFTPPDSIESIPSTQPPPPTPKSRFFDLTADPDPTLEELAEAAADLQDDLAQRNRFVRLTDHEQSVVFKLLKNHSPRAIAKLLAYPPPVGLNFKTSHASLYKFRGRYENDQAEKRRQEKIQQTQQLLDQSADPFDAFQKAAQRALQIQFLATQDEAALDKSDQILNALLRLRQQTLAERKQTQLEHHQNT